MGTRDLKVVSRLKKINSNKVVQRPGRSAKVTTVHRYMHNDHYLALNARWHRRKTAHQLARYVAAVSGRRCFQQRAYSRPAETNIYARRPVYDALKRTKQIHSRRAFTWRELGARGHPSYLTKSERFGGKGNLLRGDIMLGSRTPLYVFDSGKVNSQRYRDEVFDVYGRFFWML
ncbi:hypothetical protein TNCV_4893341 [Trichonephila clavipes]|nr:hypothetical protein TNCV_4893341 [Trichonephila clavipes]